ncbi:MAG: M48 family metallopeptidase [Gammaproteobacteria bacterium]|nr:M48 family metallopeptidase [Gammaproteobacteria bacterium]
MDFFSLQEKARKQTKYLVMLFLAAVLAIVLAVNLLVFWAMSQDNKSLSLSAWLEDPLWIYISGGLLVMIIITSLFRTRQLSASPQAIAHMVNATPISANSKNALEVRLQNVVEEMSIASGMPMPQIFVMKEEDGINAFVAGTDPSQVTLVVTQGLLENLSRQELQGVIGHEFSHVFHGDMKINVRLIGILAGILVIGQFGEMLLRNTSRSSRRSSRGKNGNAGAALIFAFGLMAIGYIGLFFGRLIKAAISRQREFLADASAIQYTRDKQGICNALFKIELNSQGALLNAAKAEEMSHMCFGQSVKMFFADKFATHPPIRERIIALDPRFDFNGFVNNTNDISDVPLDDNSNFAEIVSGLSAAGNYSTQKSENDIKSILEEEKNLNSANKLSNNISNEQQKIDKLLSSVGNMTEKQLAAAREIIASIPNSLLELARGKANSKFGFDFIIALITANQQTTASSKNKFHNFMADKSFQELTIELKKLDFRQQHILLEIALNTLFPLSQNDKKDFSIKLGQLINQDNRVTQNEFMIYATTLKKLLPTSKQKTINRFSAIKTEISYFFNLLYQNSNLTTEEKVERFQKQMRQLGIETAQLNNQALSVNKLNEALKKIACLNNLLKKDFLQMCIDIVENDQQITQSEFELIRLLAAYMAVPVPVILLN